MASPITWKNIAAPNFNGVNQALDSAGDRLSSGLDNIRGIIRSDAAQREQQWANTKERNTDNELARILSQNTLEGLDGLGGDVNAQALQNNYGNQVDKLKVLNAFNQRDNNIRADTTEQNAFDDAETQRKERDLVGRVKELTAVGDYTGVDNLLATEGDDLLSITRAGLRKAVKEAKNGDADTAWKAYERNYNKGQNDRNLANQKSTDNIDALVGQVIDLDMTEAEMRSEINRLGKGLPHKTINGALNKLKESYGQRFSLTAEDQLAVSEHEEASKRYYAPEITKINEAKTDVKNRLANIPEYANPTVKPLTRADVTRQVLKEYNITSGDYFDWETNSSGGTDTLDGYSDNMGEVIQEANILATKAGLINQGQDVDMRIVLTAIREAGLEDYDGDDNAGEFNAAHIKEKLPRIIEDVVRNSAKYSAYKQRERELDTDLNNINTTIRDEIRYMEKGLKGENKLKLQGRYQK